MHGKNKKQRLYDWLLTARSFYRRRDQCPKSDYDYTADGDTVHLVMHCQSSYTATKLDYSNSIWMRLAETQ